jgi:hypothetical protein
MMKHSLFLVILLASGMVFGAGSFLLEAPVIIGETDDILSYDDGSAHWLTWGGLYRGVWFDATDFDPLAIHFYAGYMEYWFFHHASYPWDTASFYAELWNGDAAGPVDQLNQTSMIATHYAPVHANYSPTILTDVEFWGLLNTSLSSGGWPSILGDNTPHIPSHSFYSDDFIIWEPWIVIGATASDYFVRASGNLSPYALESASWGFIKGMYR